MSCGPRIVQRAAGQSASSRRPSSNAATSWAALAAPMPGHRRELQLRRAGQPGQAVVPGERVGGEVDAPTARVCPSPTAAPISSADGQATDAAQGQPLAWPLGDRHLADGPAGRRPERRGRSCDPDTRSPPRAGRGDRASPRPGRREPADSPAIRTSRTSRSLPAGPHRPVNRRSPRLTSARRRAAAAQAGRLRSSGRRPRRGSAGSPLNAACSPNEAQIVPRRTNSQPSASATGIRPSERHDGQPERVARPSRRRSSGRGRRRRTAAPTTRPAADAQPAHPGRRGEAAEQDLLAERRHHGAGQERQDEPDRRRRSVAAG